MRIAFIVEAFPALTQTFILDQITGLIDRGHEVDIYAQMQDDLQKTHPDVEKYRLRDRTYYQPLYPRNKFLRLLQALWLLIGCFFRDPILVLRSLNLWKYGKDAASLRLFYSVIPFLGDRRQYDIIQCHFGLPWGAKGVAASYSLFVRFILLPVLFWFVGRTGPVQTKDFYRTAAPIAFASLAPTLVLTAFRYWYPTLNPIVGCGVAAVLTATTFLAALYLIPEGRYAIKDLKDLAIVLKSGKSSE